jgi:hypothetical protein
LGKNTTLGQRIVLISLPLPFVKILTVLNYGEWKLKAGKQIQQLFLKKSIQKNIQEEAHPN